MKVLFVVKSKAIETLGVMYLAAVVKKCGHEARIVDVKSSFVEANEWKPDVLGFSVMTGDQKLMTELNLKIKRSAISIFGGPHATFFSQDFYNDLIINYVVKGEAEQFMAAFLESDKKFDRIESLPWPDRTDFSKHKIRDFITSRGCPYNCSYCYNDRWSQMYPGEPVRTREVSDVIKEIMFVKPEFVYFQDSCFGVNMSWLREFSGQYRHLYPIPFHCHLRPAQVNQERVILLHDAHCMSTRIALETANKSLLKILNREKTDLNQVLDAARLFKKWNIQLMIQNMIGLPTGTIENDLETLEFNIRCQPAYGWCSIFQPYPGTELGDRCLKEGWYKGDYSEITDCFFDGSVLEFSDLYKEQLQCLQKIFALAVEVHTMPEIHELTHENFPKLVHKLMRGLGDRRLFGYVT